MDGWMDGWTDGWVGGLTDGWPAGRTNGQQNNMLRVANTKYSTTILHIMLD